MKKIVFILLFPILLVSEEIYASFDVVPQKTAKLSLAQIGIVDKIFYGIGDFVKQGDILLTLKSDDENLALLNAKNDLNIAITSRDYAANTLKRFNAIKSVTSKQEYDKVKFEFDNANLLVERAKLSIQNANNLIDKKILKVPFDGVIVAKNIEVGDGVGGVSQPLFIINSKESKLLLTFDEKYKNLVKVGSNFRYKIDDVNYVGKISLIYPFIDTKSRKIIAEVGGVSFLSGIFGEGFIEVK